ncbi:MAG: type II toxin-antitoxin system RelE/ParE family toxin [Pyrinomonadaceae bacterium]
MTEIIWTSPAFLVLENLPQAAAFGIVRRVEYLRYFPQMGPVIIRPRKLSKYRQLIFRHEYRIIYRFDADENCVRIVNIQSCRQKFPDANTLDRARDLGDELPLE